MEKKDTIKFMQRIKSHYQDFIIDDFKIDDWHKELKNYDFEDVDLKLDEHLRNEFFGDKIPKLYFLTKYLIPTDEKGKIKHYTVRCQNCGAMVFDNDYDKHYSRCSSTMTIIRDMKRYFNIEVDFEEITKFSENKFEELYKKYCEKMIICDKVPAFQKKIILRILYPNYELNIDEMLVDILKGIKGE